MSATKIHPDTENEDTKEKNGGFSNKAFVDDETLENGFKKDVLQEEEDDSDLKCSYGPCKGGWLQFFLGVRWFVLWLCIFGFVEGAAVNGIVNIILTTLESRYNLPSSQSALIVSSTDIGALIFVLFVSYMGAKGNRPRWISGGCLIMAVGSFIFIIPHMLSDTYNWLGQANNLNDSHICSANNTDPCDNRQSVDASWFLYLFMLAQFIHGIGFTPMFTLGTAYVDDNASTESTSIYLGLIYAITALGVAAGYMGGGQLLNIWVDFDNVDTTVIYDTMTIMDPRWIGAWWLGFVITAICFFLVAIPILGYPKNLPGTAKIRAARITDAERERMAAKANDKRPLLKKVLDFPKAIFVLLKLPTFMLIVLGGSAETLIIGGLAAFAPKVLEEKFDVNPADAGLIMGGVTIGGGAGGMVLGGVLIKIFKLDLKGMVRLCALCSVLALLVGAGFFINCPDVDFAGVTQPYMLNGIMNSANSLIGYCNEACSCNTFNYEPVCGADGFTYFSPCHAGCTDNFTVGPMSKSYASCLCVEGRLLNNSITDIPPTATSGECATSCPIMGLFVFLLFLGMLCTLTTVTPASMAILRCVPDEHRALGLGLQWVALRCFGTIPGPVLTGYVIDTSCGIWQDLCGDQGSCWFYDRQEMSWRLFTWWCAVKVFSGTTFFLSSLFYKPPPEKSTAIKTEGTKPSENGTKEPVAINNGDSSFEKNSNPNENKGKKYSDDQNNIEASTYM